eukprot:1725787-Rhodomonas_salina.1
MTSASLSSAEPPASTPTPTAWTATSMDGAGASSTSGLETNTNPTSLVQKSETSTNYTTFFQTPAPFASSAPLTTSFSVMPNVTGFWPIQTQASMIYFPASTTPRQMTETAGGASSTTHPVGTPTSTSTNFTTVFETQASFTSSAREPTSVGDMVTHAAWTSADL